MEPARATFGAFVECVRADITHGKTLRFNMTKMSY